MKVSYSKFKTYLECPLKFKFQYVDKLGEYSDSVHTLFGTAMHEVIQNYLTEMYSNGPGSADKLKLEYMLHTRIGETFPKIDATEDEMIEFYQDGVEIIKAFRRHRKKYFPYRNHKLIGIEYSLSAEFDIIDINGFIDIIIHDEKNDIYRVIDLKTSTRGWGESKKKDDLTNYQVLLYKQFFSQQYGVDINKIQVEFIILKRKVFVPEGINPINARIATHKPASGKLKMNRFKESLKQFINEALTDNGKEIVYNTAAPYTPTPSTSTCAYCDFKKPCKQFINDSKENK